MSEREAVDLEWVILTRLTRSLPTAWTLSFTSEEAIMGTAEFVVSGDRELGDAQIEFCFRSIRVTFDISLKRTAVPNRSTNNAYLRAPENGRK